ncbi:hypothetical protein [Caulobacter sp.]|uniref:hypothetical protein n=1 Tax=Caulobacter sp. TaxID=78 RepID=UPI001B11BCBA|nr:hypothetical protein [Caulobacter sp.]MBO9545404.1 hypothetical protein [Caulobacter sp.]
MKASLELAGLRRLQGDIWRGSAVSQQSLGRIILKVAHRETEWTAIGVPSTAALGVAGLEVEVLAGALLPKLSIVVLG